MRIPLLALPALWPPRLFHLMLLARHRLLKAIDATYKEAPGIGSTQLGLLFILEKKPGAPRSSSRMSSEI